VGFIFMCFRLVSEGMSVILLFMIFLTWDFVGLIIEVWKLFVCKNSSILDSYCAVGKITSFLYLPI